MEWSIDEDVPWLTPSDSSGINPAAVQLLANPAGYTIGEYLDSMFIVAPEATNSPGRIRVRLQVWRFHGDVEWDGDLDVSDISYFVAFLFLGGPAPKPELIVADMNCDEAINVSDLSYFITYMFEAGPIPCGNPYK
jgi:hypothetical protein